MNDLHLALGALAVVLLGGVFAYSKWQERRALRQLQEAMREGVGDALLTPSTARASQGPVAPQSPPPAGASRIEPTFGPMPDSGINVEAPPPPAVEHQVLPAGWVEDPLLDCVLEVRCSHAVDGIAVIDAAAPLARMKLPLPVHLVAWDGRAQQWAAPDRFGFYAELLVAMQLAHRKHTINEIEASQFVAAVQQLAMALDADFDPPETKRMVELAADLDKLCARFDVRIGLTVELDSEPDKGRLAEAAQAADLDQIGPQRWQRCDAAGAPLFSLNAADSALRRLALELDVPIAAPTAKPLRQMYTAAADLATTLGGRVIDDEGRPVLPESIDAIERQLVGLYDDMLAAGIEPGSLRARRLYA